MTGANVDNAQMISKLQELEKKNLDWEKKKPRVGKEKAKHNLTFLAKNLKIVQG